METHCWIQSRESLSVGGSRWYLRAVVVGGKLQCESSNLPPTTTALKYNIYRYHYVTLVLHRSLSTIQNLPSPWNYGWHGEAYLPILTDELLASISLTEMSMYSCKTKCGTNRCKFRKNVSWCADMCKCVDCENDDVHDASDNQLEYLINHRGQRRCLI